MTERPRLFRVALHVSDIGRALECYSTLLGLPGIAVGPGRSYFHTDGAILVCVDPVREGHDWLERRANAGHTYFAVDDVEAYAERARDAGCTILDGPVDRDWGERSFYARDPFGNPLCLVEAATAYTALPAAERATTK